MALDLGFNPEEVRTSIEAVKTSYEHLMQAINKDVQNVFFQQMSEMWACVQAQEFFTALKEHMDNVINSSNSTFESIVAAMNSAARAWAAKTKYPSYQDIPITLDSSVLDASVIHENINNIRGIDSQNATTTVETCMGAITDGTESAVNEAKSAVETCGFLDYGNVQASELSSSVTSIGQAIKEVMDQTSGDVAKAIRETLESYGDTQGQIQQAFAGGK